MERSPKRYMKSSGCICGGIDYIKSMMSRAIGLCFGWDPIITSVAGHSIFKKSCFLFMREP